MTDSSSSYPIPDTERTDSDSSRARGHGANDANYDSRPEANTVKVGGVTYICYDGVWAEYVV